MNVYLIMDIEWHVSLFEMHMRMGPHNPISFSILKIHMQNACVWINHYFLSGKPSIIRLYTEWEGKFYRYFFVAFVANQWELLNYGIIAPLWNLHLLTSARMHVSNRYCIDRLISHEIAGILKVLKDDLVKSSPHVGEFRCKCWVAFLCAVQKKSKNVYRVGIYIYSYQVYVA